MSSSSSVQVNSLRCLFFVLGCLMLGTAIYTLYTDGPPSSEKFSAPWMAATLVDFYIQIVVLAVWVSYKVPNWIGTVFWIILLVNFGCIASCAFILLQLLKFSPQDPLEDPMYYVLVQQHNKNDTEKKRKSFSVMVARMLFIALSCLMLGTLIYTLLTDGSPFHMELLTPWMKATRVDFYINIVTFSVWIVYKEEHRISALLWIVVLICLGSISTCAYIAIQLFKLSSQDPLFTVLLNSRSRMKRLKM